MSVDMKCDDNMLYKEVHPVDVEITSSYVAVCVNDNDPEGGDYDYYLIPLKKVLEDMIIEQGRGFDHEGSTEMVAMLRQYADKLELDMEASGRRGTIT